VHDVLSIPLAVDVKGSKTTIQGDAKVIQVDYSNEESIKYALAGVDVVISTVSIPALDVQEKIAAAAKEVGVKLFVPSEYAAITDGETEGLPGVKANVQGQLKALGMPYAAFYNGGWADFIWIPYVSWNTSFLYLFCPSDDKSIGSFTSTSRAGKCQSVVMVTSKSRSPPGPMLPDI